MDRSERERAAVAPFCIGVAGREQCSTCTGRLPAGQEPTLAILTHQPWPFEPCPHYAPTPDVFRGAYGRGELMVTAAVRYCLGRSSYIVGDCCDWLCQVWSSLDDATKAIVRKDVDNAFQRDEEARLRGDAYRPLGMDMDRREWARARKLWGAS